MTSTISVTNNSTTSDLALLGDISPSTVGGGSPGTKTLAPGGSGNGAMTGNIFDQGSPLNPKIALTKSGTGTWTLSPINQNTYTGTTTISDGVLRLNRRFALPGGLQRVQGLPASNLTFDGHSGGGGVVGLGFDDFERRLGPSDLGFNGPAMVASQPTAPTAT